MKTTCSDKLAAVKADVERVEKETEQNMHTLVEMDRQLVDIINDIVLTKCYRLPRSSGAI